MHENSSLARGARCGTPTLGRNGRATSRYKINKALKTAAKVAIQYKIL
jgi:hypothetical protein